MVEFNKQEANFNNFLSLFVDIFVILISLKMIRVTAVVSDVLEDDRAKDVAAQQQA